ncbi:4335_t:CDS:2 [Entrophospora sp. SA101]|nr:4335_t:CDS:2 [Entrophospora sp. SA101]
MVVTIIAIFEKSKTFSHFARSHTADESCEEDEISSVYEVVFDHNDNNNINNPTKIKWSFDINLNNNQRHVVITE